MEKTLSIYDVTFDFQDTCPKCKCKQDNVTDLDIQSILLSGTPICQECGEELEVEEKCSVNYWLINKNASVAQSEEQYSSKVLVGEFESPQAFYDN